MILFDYKKFLKENDFGDNALEVFKSPEDVEVFGTEKELLYLASRIIEFVEENAGKNIFAELNFDAGIDLSSDSSDFRIFFKSAD